MFEEVVEPPAGTETPGTVEVLQGLSLLQRVIVVEEIEDDTFVQGGTRIVTGDSGDSTIRGALG